MSCLNPTLTTPCQESSACAKTVVKLDIFFENDKLSNKNFFFNDNLSLTVMIKLIMMEGIYGLLFT